LAISNDSKQAREIADDLGKRFPEDSCVQFSYLPILRALIALDDRDASKAVALLHAAIPDELGAPRSSIHALFGALYPIYVSGEAYLAEGKPGEAAAEFQAILDHPGITVSDPVGVLAHLQLARAYAMSGERTKARSAYQDFLAIWKDADPDIPISETGPSRIREARVSDEHPQEPRILHRIRRLQKPHASETRRGVAQITLGHCCPSTSLLSSSMGIAR
jgi:tetratricopeptide (TPR) repeat protein